MPFWLKAHTVKILHAHEADLNHTREGSGEHLVLKHHGVHLQVCTLGRAPLGGDTSRSSFVNRRLLRDGSADKPAEEELYRREEMVNMFGENLLFKQSKILAFSRCLPSMILTGLCGACKGVTLEKCHATCRQCMCTEH